MNALYFSSKKLASRTCTTTTWSGGQQKLVKEPGVTCNVPYSANKPFSLKR
jgi:hypothetical protein